MRVNIVIGLLGLIAGLLIAMAAGTGGRPVFAQGGAADGSALAVAANFNNQQEDLVWVFDARKRVLSVYKYKNNMIELIGARNVTWDLQVPVSAELIYRGTHLKPSAVEKAVKPNKPPKKGG